MATVVRIIVAIVSSWHVHYYYCLSLVRPSLVVLPPLGNCSTVAYLPDVVVRSAAWPLPVLPIAIYICCSAIFQASSLQYDARDVWFLCPLIIKHNNKRICSLMSSQAPTVIGEAQQAFNIQPEASFIATIKNPHVDPRRGRETQVNDIL